LFQSRAVKRLQPVKIPRHKPKKESKKSKMTIKKNGIGELAEHLIRAEYQARESNRAENKTNIKSRQTEDQKGDKNPSEE